MREAELPGIPYIHFNGASGNIGAGKYNDGDIANRAILAGRLADGHRKAWEATVKTPLVAEEIMWKTTGVILPVRGEISDENERTVLASAELDERMRLQAAVELAFRQRMQSGRPIELSALHLGSTVLVHLPGELFIEYQLAAQAIRDGKQVCVAAYADYGPGYIGTAINYPQGGYETQLYVSRTAPEVEPVLMEGIRSILE